MLRTDIRILKPKYYPILVMLVGKTQIGYIKIIESLLSIPIKQLGIKMESSCKGEEDGLIAQNKKSYGTNMND